MITRVFLLLWIVWGVSEAATGQGLRMPVYSGSLKRDTTFVNKATVPRPTFSAVKYDYYKHLGVACKLEFKFEQSTKLPLRLRLGSLQQTDYLEQKPNAIKPER